MNKCCRVPESDPIQTNWFDAAPQSESSLGANTESMAMAGLEDFASEADANSQAKDIVDDSRCCPRCLGIVKVDVSGPSSIEWVPLLQYRDIRSARLALATA